MKKIVLALMLSLLLSLSAFAQGAKLSPATKQLVSEAQPHWNASGKESYSLPQEVVSKYHLKQVNGRYYVTGMLKVEAGADNAALEALGAEIRTSTRTIRTFSIPVDAIPALAELPGVKFVQIDEGVKKKLKEAVAETGTDRVHQGEGDLPQAFDGSGVVVGVIDGGFDPAHPAFRSADGERLRVVRYWKSGESLETEEAILGGDPDNPDDTHGTHVAGIAGGSNWQSPVAERTGYAPASDLVFATYGGGETLESGILDAINYVFSYASAQGKPAVINMSLGTHLGPHDGASLFDQGCDELLEGSKGRVLVGASGNEGGTALHLSHTFAANDTIKTVVQFELTGEPFSPYLGSGLIDAWGEAGKEFSVGVQVIGAAGETLYQSENFVSSTVEGENMLAYEVGEDGAGIKTTTNPAFVNNNKPNIRIEAANNIPAFVVLWITGEEGSTVHFWNHGTGSGAAFVDTLEGGVQVEGAVVGDVSSTNGEIGGTARSIITVGAYTTLNQYNDIDDNAVTIGNFAEVGQIAPFSSQGPTTDGRVKPDITAPGNVVVAAGASFTMEKYRQMQKVVDAVDVAGTMYPYIALEGTSMATPGITGIVALMLQANPELSYEDVKGMLQNSARTDDFTGSIPAAGSNVWGKGKVDAFAAVLAAAQTVSVPEKLNGPRGLAFACFPNPAADAFTINPTRDGAYVATLSDATGRRVWTRSLSGAQQIDARDLPQGLYILQLDGNATRQYVKLLIAR